MAVQFETIPEECRVAVRLSVRICVASGTHGTGPRWPHDADVPEEYGEA